MKFTKGLNKDVDPTAQPEGTYRELINGIVKDDMGTIQLEDGTTNKNTLSGNIIGDIILSNNQIVLFTDDNKILLFDDSSLSTIVDDISLNLSTTVVGTHTVDNNEDTIIYFTDGTNPPRFLNITNPPTDVSNNLTVNIKNLNLFPTYDSQSPSFTLNDVSNGGSLKAGSYYLTFAYIDDDQTLTDYFFVSNPIVITDRNRNGTFEDERTNKRINFTLSNLDTNYDRVRVTSIRETNVEQIIDLQIDNSGSLTYSYNGNEDTTVGSLDEVVINSPIYDELNAIEQHDNSLYLGGLKEKRLTKEQKQSLQKTALNAEVNAITEHIRGDFYNDPINIYNKRSFKRGEVYALYMSFILDDGRETDAFHIPGRESLNGGIIDSTATIDIISVDTPDD